MFSNLEESWLEVSHAARELATSLSFTFFLSNNSWSMGRNIPQTRVFRHIVSRPLVVIDLQLQKNGGANKTGVSFVYQLIHRERQQAEEGMGNANQ